MKRVILLVISLSAFLGLYTSVEVVSLVSASDQTSAVKDCSYNRNELLALDENSFDQDMNGGWRDLASRDDCLEVAADLIREYRETHELESGTLYWHEGQLRAMAGKTNEAIPLMEKSHNHGESASVWNQYVYATTAFLRQDMDGLKKARAALLQIPRHPDYPSDRTWPPNIKFVDAFVECFGREYKDSYGSCKKL